MICSARSLEEDCNAEASLSSSSAVSPLRTVPAMGWVMIRPLSALTNISGEAPTS